MLLIIALRFHEQRVTSGNIDIPGIVDLSTGAASGVTEVGAGDDHPGRLSVL